jgi:hypothetical protein
MSASKRIGLHLAAAGAGRAEWASAMGGGEKTLATLAEALRLDHHVEIVNRGPAVDLARLAEVSGVRLDGVHSKSLPLRAEARPQPPLSWRSAELMARYRRAQADDVELSAPYSAPSRAPTPRLRSSG